VAPKGYEKVRNDVIDQFAARESGKGREEGREGSFSAVAEPRRSLAWLQLVSASGEGWISYLQECDKRANEQVEMTCRGSG
jgi:hypothetical protein